MSTTPVRISYTKRVQFSYINKPITVSEIVDISEDTTIADIDKFVKSVTQDFKLANPAFEFDRISWSVTRFVY